MLEAIERLRESFSDARSARQEAFYGIETRSTRYRQQNLLRVLWRNYSTREEGELCVLDKGREIEELGVLLTELDRLRSLRRLKVAA